MATSVKDRLLAAACYFGFAPWVRRWRLSTSFIQHHFEVAMVAWFIFFVLALAYFFLNEIVISGFLIFLPEAGKRLTEHFSWLAPYVGYTAISLVGLFCLGWLILIGMALFGTVRPIPFLKRLQPRKHVVYSTFVATCLFWIVAPILIISGSYEESRTSRNKPGAAVYFLYDDGIAVPRAGYALGLIRVSRWAEKHWGRGSVVLDQLNSETLRTALASGKVVMLATHGDSGYAGTYYSRQTLCVGPAGHGVTDDQKNRQFLQTCILPYDYESWERLRRGKWTNWSNVPIGKDLKLMYIFACYAGTRSSEWTEHVAPARVITYNRLSTVWDHALWFAFTGPRQLENL